jgi:hypothetical protein
MSLDQVGIDAVDVQAADVHLSGDVFGVTVGAVIDDGKLAHVLVSRRVAGLEGWQAFVEKSRSMNGVVQYGRPAAASPAGAGAGQRPGVAGCRALGPGKADSAIQAALPVRPAAVRYMPMPAAIEGASARVTIVPKK